MRYMAQRAVSGEWLHRDLPLSDVERVRDLSGPGGINATISPELRNAFHTDGMRVLDRWGTYIYAVDETGRIRNAGIFVDASYEESDLKMTCPGFTSYTQGSIYKNSRLWGPDVDLGLDRPDPLVIVQDLWGWLQTQQDSNLGMRIVGTLASTERVGDYEEPYRLAYYDTPDIGGEIDNLAKSTPFDYVEEHEWADDDQQIVDHRFRIGWPRLGKRHEGRFVLGENITEAIPLAATGGRFANDVIGIGNGDGPTMAYSNSTIRDGRLRRTRVITDKTLGPSALDNLVLNTRERTDKGNDLDIATVKVQDHPNARLSTIEPGDDIFVQTYIPSYGDIRMWVRVLSIAEDEAGDIATLSTRNSATFLYSATIEEAGS